MKNFEEKIIKDFSVVFDFCQRYNKQKNPLLAGSATARIVCHHLNSARECILSSIPTSNYIKLSSSISWGSGKFPRVPWIAFHLQGKKVSNALSVVICFSKDGRGVVVGLMAAATLSTKLKTVTRTKHSEYLNINSSTRTQYNNKFLNPKEFFSNQLNLQDVINHIIESINLLYENQTDL